MFAKFTVSNVKPGHLDDALQVMRDTVLPRVKEQPGFRRATLLADRKGNRMVSFSVWATKADVERLAQGFFQEAAGALREHLVAPPETTDCELGDEIAA